MTLIKTTSYDGSCIWVLDYEEHRMLVFGESETGRGLRSRRRQIEPLNLMTDGQRT